MKKKMKTFAKTSISTLRSLFSANKKTNREIFWVDGVSLAELEIDFRKVFLKASLSQNFKNSGF